MRAPRPYCVLRMLRVRNRNRNPPVAPVRLRDIAVVSRRACSDHGDRHVSDDHHVRTSVHDDGSGGGSRSTCLRRFIAISLTVIPHSKADSRPSIDGIRAIAASAVVGVHIEQNTTIEIGIGSFRFENLLANGRLGVAMFLIVSGFCFALPLWSAPPSTRLATARDGFWRRRIARIGPLYWTLVAGLCLLQIGSPRVVWDWLAHSFFVHNFFGETLYSVSEPLWAVALFMQCYLLWWLLLGALQMMKIHNDRALLFVFVILGGLAWITNAWLEKSGLAENLCGESVWLHSPMIHLPIFLLGVLASWASSHCRQVTRFRHAIDGVAGLGLLVLFLSMGLFERVALDVPASRYAYPIVPLLFALVLIAATNGCCIERVLSCRPLVVVGSISYALYLLHLPLIGLTKRVLEKVAITQNSLLLCLVSVGAAVGSAWILTLFFEPTSRAINRVERSHDG